MPEIAQTIKTKTNSKLPALSEHRFLRYLSFAILYAGQGIPEGMTIFAIPAWMAMNGKTPAEIGTYAAIIFIPFSFKILVAPLIERFTFLPMGRRRPWIIFGQFGLALSFMAMSMLPDPLNNISLLTAVGFCVSLFITFQDIATDALVIDIVPIKQQAKANGFMWGSKIIGGAASLALGTWLLNNYGFSIAIVSLSMAVFLIMLVPLLLRERPGEKILPWTPGTGSPDTAALQLNNLTKIFKSLFSVLKLPNSILLLLVLFVTLTALAFMRTIFPIFTIQELGWSNKDYSEIYAATSFVGGIIGMLAGGLLLEKFGKIRMLSVYLILLILFTTIMAFSKSLWHHAFFTTGYIALYNLIFVLIAIGLFATSMQFCWRKISALQFTLYMAIYNLGQTAGAALIGPLRKQLGWGYTILSFSIMAALALVLIQFIHIKNHLQQLEKLDNQVSNKSRNAKIKIVA
jgi:PAT family beta-lactamase induction signal transducer AmpG